MLSRHTLFFAILLVLLFSAATGTAADQEESDTDGAATITLTLRPTHIPGDTKSWCQVQLTVAATDEIESGDNITVKVLEHDPTFVLPDDLIWSTTLDTTSGALYRTFDCSANFGDDTGDNLEIYATAHVDTNGCSFCVDDKPETDNIIMEPSDDDEREDDDASGSAKTLGTGTTTDLVAMDEGDWHSFELGSNSSIHLDVIHTTTVGRLDLALFDSDGEAVTTGVATDGHTAIDMSFLETGTYRAKVSRREANNPNFYSVNFTISAAGADCTPDTDETVACGNCGTQTRTCNAGTWGEFSACTDEGVCTPGASDEGTVCGNCGVLQSVCTAECTWPDDAVCTNEGCLPESTETEACEGGENDRVRTCSASCEWGEFSECAASLGCEAEDTRVCYTGPGGTRGVGECTDGTESCSEGAWSGTCERERLPADEICDDGDDNDCDGDTDEDDSDCDTTVTPPDPTGAEIGDPCDEDDDCVSSLDCLGYPDNANFAGGYCGSTDCSSDSDCGDDGICAEIFGEGTCLRSCADDLACRGGYGCVDLEGDGACAPQCSSNSECLDLDYPTCDADTSVCGAFVASTSDDDADAGSDAGSGSSSSAPIEDDGCSITSSTGDSGLGVGLLLLGAAVVISRRRRRR